MKRTKFQRFLLSQVTRSIVICTIVLISTGLTACGQIGVSKKSTRPTGSSSLGSGQKSTPAKSKADVARKMEVWLHRPPSKDEVAYYWANELLRMKDFAGFERELNTAIKLAPKNPLYSMSLAVELMKRGRLDDSLRYAMIADNLAAQRRDPFSIETGKIVAQIRQKRKEYKEAELAYETVFARDLAFVSTFDPVTGKASKRRAYGNRELIDQLSIVRRQLPPRKVTLNDIVRDLPWTKSYLMASKIKKANAKSYLNARENDLLSGRIHGVEPFLELNSAYIDLGRSKDAVIAADVAIQLDPMNAQAWHQLGWSYLQDGRLDEALSAFEMSAKLGNTASKNVAPKLRQYLSKLSKK